MKYKLYHYSNKEIKDNIKPDYFGENIYTFNDKKYKINRSFFYTSDIIPEYKLKNCKYKYTCHIEDKYIYDLKIDKDKLKIRYVNRIEALLNYIKANYKGILYNVGFDIVCLFENISIDTMEGLK